MLSRKLRFEFLERRVVLASVAGEGFNATTEAPTITDYFPMIVASGQSGDSPANRVTTGYSAVGSLSMQGRSGSYICTGTVIDDPSFGTDYTGKDWVLTAGHCLDTNDNGRADFKASEVTFFPDGNVAAGISAQRLVLHPDFSGFGRGGSVSDDIALIQLSRPVPSHIVPHAFHEQPVGHAEFRMVGFGRSGDGVNGYTTGASFTTKRVGGNHLDDYGEGAGNSLNRDEIWRGDFDHPTNSSFNLIGYEQLPANQEATLGGGDSGGPSFLVQSGQATGIAAINTFGFTAYNATHGYITPPLFGSGLGGILVYPYLEWIDSVMTSGSGDGGGGGDGGGDKPCNPKKPGCSTATLSESPSDAGGVAALAINDVSLSNTTDDLATDSEILELEIKSRDTKIRSTAVGSHAGLPSPSLVPSSDIYDESIDAIDNVLADWPTLQTLLDLPAKF